MIVKELLGTQIINASFLFANSNISVKYYSKDFPSVLVGEKCLGENAPNSDLCSVTVQDFATSLIRIRAFLFKKKCILTLITFVNTKLVFFEK
jgi:hypothetical protein